MAASRWLRVAMAQWRETSRSVRDAISRDVDHMEAVDRFPGLLCDERDELAECIAIAVLGVASEIAFGDDMLQQETPNPGAKSFLSHEKAP